MPSIYPDMDPLDEPAWTLTMAAVWISTRSPCSVRNVWPAFCTQVPRWYFSASRGWQVLSEPMSLQWLEAFDCLGDADTPASPLSLKAARRKLWKALLAGSISAMATEIETGRLVPVPAGEWPHLFAAGDGFVDDLRVGSNFGPPRYRGPLLAVADLINLWPAIEAAETVETTDPLTPAHKQISEARIRRACDQAVGFMKDKGFPSLTRQEAEGILCALYANSRTQIRKIIANKINPADKRRPRGQLMNRNKELEDCRRFLTSAT